MRKTCIVLAFALAACGDDPEASNVATEGDAGPSTTSDAGNGDSDPVDEPDSDPMDDAGSDPMDDTGSRPTDDAGSRPAGVVSWAELEAGLLGTFVVPPAEQEGTEFRFGFSHGIHAQLENGNVLLQGHNTYDQVAEVKLPASLDGSEATRVGDWFDVTGRLLPTGWMDGESFVLGGMLEIGERIFFSKHQWYNAAADDWDSQGYFEDGTAHGLWNVAGDGAHSQRIGGYLAYAPEVLAEEGVTYLSGQQGASGAATGRWGPNLFGVKFDDAAPTGSELDALPLIYHPDESRGAPDWWVGDRASAALWIDAADRHGVLFFLVKGIGDTWYGEPNEGPDGGDPYGGAKGYHAQGWSLQVWIYDPAEILAVSRGEREPWSLSPVERTVLTERPPGSSEEVHSSFLTGPANTLLQASLRDDRLLLVDPAGNPGEFEDTPKGYVLDVPSGRR